MVRRRGPRLTLAEKTELWRRWRRGESLNAIGRALGRIAHVVRYEVARTGGIPPPARQRSRLALTLTEREAISRGRASGTSVRQISRQLRRAPSTVSREVCRHGGRRRYRAATADAVAWARGRRPKRCRLATHPALRDAVATKLTQKWSPQQIAGWLRRAYPDDPTMHVSHETIYLSLFVQSRGVLKKALQAQLRQRRTIRRPRTAPRPSGGYIVGAVSIRERPATVEDRAVPGHWEGDLLVGARQPTGVVHHRVDDLDRRQWQVGGCGVAATNAVGRESRLPVNAVWAIASRPCFASDVDAFCTRPPRAGCGKPIPEPLMALGEPLSDGRRGVVVCDHGDGSKMSNGSTAVTPTFGASTTCAIRRSTATLATM